MYSDSERLDEAHDWVVGDVEHKLWINYDQPIFTFAINQILISNINH